jgi:hypothetical protein
VSLKLETTQERDAVIERFLMAAETADRAGEAFERDLWKAAAAGMEALDYALSSVGHYDDWRVHVGEILRGSAE